eukprot:Tbor_TRINITY_DN3580_c0_g1::TRINITY_DN3580_c0_g1_i1::g.2831::m.2831/K00012/UGDH, ugd; UDPglucose 6-dehydrogenase
MNIVCIGAGYVGGPTMAMIALKCHDIKVTIFDINKERIDAWNSDKLPIFEPGLHEIVMERRGKNLFFTTDNSCITEGDIIFISVNTPTKDRGIGKGRAADLKFIESCSRMIGDLVVSGHKIIVEKSTVPVRCSVAVRKILENRSSKDASFTILSNPEFLAEGTAMSDLATPDRVLIGGESDERGQAAIKTLSDVYARWVPRARIITTNLWSSELSKLAANAFLAQRISSINSISAICDASGANVDEVSNAIGADSRLGSKFLKASVGFGGSCFQKDILNLVYLAETLNLPEVAEYWLAVVKINEFQKSRFSERIVKDMFDTVSNKTIAILGFAFKKDTGDTRESAAINVCANLLVEGALLNIYDPKVTKETIIADLLGHIPREDTRTRDFVHTNIRYTSSAIEATKGASALCILTEWDEFKQEECDYAAHYAQMEKPAFLFDGRMMTRSKDMHDIGFQSFVIGDPHLMSVKGFLFDSF